MFRVTSFVLMLVTLLSVGAFAQAQTTRANATAAVEKAPLVNLNTATAAELGQLPGIGPKVAARIVEYRIKQGPFRKAEELMNVQGIGEKTFLKLRAQLTVSTASESSVR